MRRTILLPITTRDETALSVNRRKGVRGRGSQTRAEVGWEGGAGNETTYVDVWTRPGLGGLLIGKNEAGVS